MSYCIYLRKSRADWELEAQSGGDTLSRHRQALLDFAQQHGLSIGHIYEEGVLSGETIAARPQMQTLLTAVEQGLWEGVLCMEVERLARGDTIDQGRVARAFQLTQTKIITPLKTYCLGEEFDDEYLEFGLFMSRREYKTINRRQQRGRLASLSEGKWISNRTPYGYDRQKLTGEKGWILVPNDETAPVVRHIFQWYASGEAGLQAIATRLNQLGIPSATGRDWVVSSLRDLLRNPVYCGLIRWQNRPLEKRVENGTIVLSRPKQSEKVQLFPGRHSPLISQDLFDQANRRLSDHPAKPGPKSLPLKNIFSHLLYCDQCGRAIVRRPYSNGKPAQLICPYPHCPTKGSYETVVEEAVLTGLRQWFGDLTLDYNATLPHLQLPSPRETLQLALSSARNTLQQLDRQLERAFELVETGVYTPELFAQRTATLSHRRADALERVDQLERQLGGLADPPLPVAPPVKTVLEVYSLARTPLEKNQLLRALLVRIDYHKTTGGRHASSDLQLTLHPAFSPK